MAFTEEQRAKIIDVIKSKSPKGLCPGCGNQQWTLAQDVCWLKTSDPASPQVSVLPSIALVCETCGMTLFYNVMRLGLAADLGVSTEQATKSG
jgi:predicted nucleic-acid-binding Zn-ribbon protein